MQKSTLTAAAEAMENVIASSRKAMEDIEHRLATDHERDMAATRSDLEEHQVYADILRNERDNLHQGISTFRTHMVDVINKLCDELAGSVDTKIKALIDRENNRIAVLEGRLRAQDGTANHNAGEAETLPPKKKIRAAAAN